MTMVTIYYHTIDNEILDVARSIAIRQKENVKVNTPTDTLEVIYEEVSEEEKAIGQKSESEEP